MLRHVLSVVLWAGAAILGVGVAACGLLEDVPEIEVDPGLRDVQDAFEPSPIDAEDLPEGEPSDVPEEPGLFSCQPGCLGNQYCGPQGLCYALLEACGAAGNVCNPESAGNAGPFWCEPVFEGSAGYCRRRCDRDEACESGETCSPKEDGSGSFCRASCESDGECGGLEVCVEPEGVCRAACLPFREDACGDGGACVPLGEGRGYCEPRGTVPEGHRCRPEGEELRCAGGATCLETSAGYRCHRPCVPGASEAGRCGRGVICAALPEREIGACLTLCSLFGNEVCPHEGQGCVVESRASEDRGICMFRGSVQGGGSCAQSWDCEGTLHCIEGASGKTCEALCVPGESSEEYGACLLGRECVAQADGGLGVCR